ncbi:conserved repeat domain protein [Deinococcus proteolyticus MRP]|uniref:Conserved repeat domain protein n=1 Tax=Deinococcus proteolyticus (strain ATCC 35074 / DSM 20540 / JCM 6276 / NBRC 101906 / NCIMB 13154 / VKM Ac-1939 / CCM 2703 / MRP) TaxID=693977 RepID=F0RIY3_DEIPM|nr:MULTISPECIES: DUF11 domain-containing protein [Deinococcus]ADY25242.1 conserved repeat domain protein [Deinococcus proteolyticus MRP]MCY1703342.1 DUF11 domain-containing protein [Deinococcus sp. SL84]
MKKFLLIPALLGLGVPALAQTASAPATTSAQQTQQSPVQLVLNDFLVTNVRGADGKPSERLNPDASRVRPGDMIQYDLSAKNVGRTPLNNVRPSLPVPAGTVFVASSGGTGNAVTEYSFDGGKTFGKAPLFRNVTVTENGKAVTRRVQVQPSEYTNVRWNLGALAPGQTHKMTLRVRVR